ncbi:MAG TPA: hypothetical protein VN231_05930 [Allosphingosinicella sp.]|nr:hypothetical protein [Allosphingosinicella sp.]
MTAARPPAPAAGLLLTEAEVAGWVRMALPGESFVYCRGPSSVPPGPTKNRINALRDAGAVRPHSRRGPDGWEHLIVKRGQEQVPASAPRPAPPPDSAIEEIFAALERCAERRRRAFSDAELARIAGLATRNQAAWRVTRLIRDGRIRTETVAAPDGTQWRVVVIPGSRPGQAERRTALPAQRRAGG